MKILDLIINPFFWIILSIIIAIIIYIIVSNSKASNRVPCKSNEDLIGGKCYTKCQDSESRCGLTCYNTKQDMCDSNNTICDISNTSCKTCCPKNQRCDKGKCIKCDGNLCDDGSCPGPNQSCYAGISCNINKQGKDTNENKKCCSQDLCGGICCDTGAGELCDPVTNKCVIGCPDPKQMDLYQCGGIIPAYPGTSSLPCGTNQICMHSCDKNTFSCIDKNNCWNNTIYTPNLLAGNDANTTYKNTNGEAVSVCQDTNDPNNITYWISSYSSKNPLTSTVSATTKLPNKDTCTKNSCVERIESDSSTIINFKTPDVKINSGTCSGSLSCDKSLLNFDTMSALCKEFENNTNTQGRCCKNNIDGFTGQICPPESTCIDGKCEKNSEYCGNGGTFNTQTRTCNCGTNYNGNRCQYSRDTTCDGNGNPNFDGTCTMDYECVLAHNPKDNNTTCCSAILGNCTSEYVCPPNIGNQDVWNIQPHTSLDGCGFGSLGNQDIRKCIRQKVLDKTPLNLVKNGGDYWGNKCYVDQSIASPTHTACCPASIQNGTCYGIEDGKCP